MDTSDKEPEDHKKDQAGVDGVEVLKEVFEAVSEAGHSELLGFAPTDEGVAVTVVPGGLGKPVTVELRVVSATVLSPEAAKRVRRRFGWPEPSTGPPDTGP